jgi:hypothetical protein
LQLTIFILKRANLFLQLAASQKPTRRISRNEMKTRRLMQNTISVFSDNQYDFSSTNYRQSDFFGAVFPIIRIGTNTNTG